MGKRKIATHTKKSRKRGDFEVVRCESLFPGKIKHHFPSPMNNLDDWDDWFDDDSYEIEHTYPPRMMKKKNKLKIVEGMRLEKDVVSLLSNGGKRNYLVRNNGEKVPLAESIVGKYLVICCFAIPLLSCDWTSVEICSSMIATYSHLKEAAAAANNNNNFEMVMVAKMTSATMVANDDEESAFNRFFKAFPCLAIPFSDAECRDLLCYALGLTINNLNTCVLALDPDQTVLQTYEDCFVQFGAAAFPFTPQHLDALHRQDRDIKLRLDFIEREFACSEELITTTPWHPVSLLELLGGCHLLHKLSSSDDDEEVISVTELSKKKCVGLYLFYDGGFMKQLKRIHKECVAKNLEFEIVVIYIPFSSDTTSFINAVNRRLKKKRLISSWWVMPFVDEVNRRLWRLCDQLTEDNLITVAEDGWGDLAGKDVIEELGYVRSYPFTRKGILDDTLRRLRSFTVESLLSVRCYQLIKDDSNGCRAYVPVSVLKDRNVLLYLDTGGDKPRGVFYKLIRDSYKHIQKKYPGTQVVFVPLERTFPKKYPCPCLILPLGAAIEANVLDQLYLEDMSKCSTLMAFGKDGLMLSRKAQRSLLDDRGVSLFDDTLRQEIVEDLADYYRFCF